MVERNTVAPNREIFAGDVVKVAKKTRVFDEKRDHEGLDHIPQADRPVLDVDVTGIEGQVQGAGYVSPRHGEVMVPIKTRGGAVLTVPASRLKKVATPSDRASFSMSRPARQSARKRGSLIKAMITSLIPSFMRPKKKKR